MPDAQTVTVLRTRAVQRHAWHRMTNRARRDRQTETERELVYVCVYVCDEENVHVKATRALHIHEETVRALYQALLLVNAGLVGGARVQEILGLLGREMEGNL